MQHALLMQCDQESDIMQEAFDSAVVYGMLSTGTFELRIFNRDVIIRVMDESCKGENQRGVTKGNHLPASHLVQGRHNH